MYWAIIIMNLCLIFQFFWQRGWWWFRITLLGMNINQKSSIWKSSGTTGTCWLFIWLSYWNVHVYYYKKCKETIDSLCVQECPSSFMLLKGNSAYKFLPVHSLNWFYRCASSLLSGLVWIYTSQGWSEYANLCHLLFFRCQYQNFSTSLLWRASPLPHCPWCTHPQMPRI